MLKLKPLALRKDKKTAQNPSYDKRSIRPYQPIGNRFIPRGLLATMADNMSRLP